MSFLKLVFHTHCWGAEISLPLTNSNDLISQLDSFLWGKGIFCYFSATGVLIWGASHVIRPEQMCPTSEFNIMLPTWHFPSLQPEDRTICPNLVDFKEMEAAAPPSGHFLSMADRGACGSLLVPVGGF